METRPSTDVSGLLCVSSCQETIPSSRRGTYERSSLPSQRARMRPSQKPEDASQVHHISAVSRENTNCFLVSRHRRVTYTDVTIEWLICLFRRCLATVVQCWCQNAIRLCGQRACLVHCSLHINIGPRASSRVYPLPHRVGCRPASASVDSAPG